MNNSVASNSERPSAIGAFFRGAFSGALSGLLMVGCYSLAALVFSLNPIIGFSLAACLPAAAMLSTTSLFSGVLAAKRAMFDAPSTGHDANTTYIPIPIAGMSGPIMAPVVSHDVAPNQETSSTKSWAATTGREGDSQSCIQAILNKSTITDKGRAQAILAEHEAAALNQNTSRA